MDESKKDEGRKINLRLKPVYTLDRDKRVGADLTNVNMFLFKNGEQAFCPFRMVATRDGLYQSPCSEECPHFNFHPETRREPKGVVEKVDAKNPEHFEIVETGKIFVRLTCGSGGANGGGTFLPISNVNTASSKSESPASKIISLKQ